MLAPTRLLSALASVATLALVAGCERTPTDKAQAVAEQENKASERTAEAYGKANDKAGEAYDNAARVAANEQAKADEKAAQAQKAAYVEREDARTQLAKDLGKVDRRLAEAKVKVQTAKTTKFPKPVLEQRLKDLEAKSADLKDQVETTLDVTGDALRLRREAIKNEITTMDHSLNDLESQLS